MIYKNLLLALNELDDEDLNHQILVENLDILEKAHSKLHGLLIKARMKRLMIDFGQKDTDVYIVGYPRSGSTLLQMLLYQMTTDGDMEFDHIYDVSPWCRYSAIINQPMRSIGKHRIIKTHDPYKMFGTIKKGKFILIVRDCLDVVSSVYQQTLDYVDREADFEMLGDRNMKRWFDYNLEWLENKDQREILFIHYEDLIERKEEIIEAVSRFLDVELNDEVLNRILQNTSFDFMKKYESKFGEQPDKGKVYNNFIRKGKSGEGKEIFNKRQLQDYFEMSKKYNIDNTPLERYFKE